MSKKYILIDSEKIKIANWSKWLMLIGGGYLILLVFTIVEHLISRMGNINISNVLRVTFYIRAFVILSLIYDLAPRFKKTIAIIWSLFTIVIYISLDARVGDRLYLGTALFLIIIIAYNIFLFIKALKLKKLNDVS